VKRSLYYIVPAALFAFVFNIPSLLALEVEMKEEGGLTINAAFSEQPHYVYWLAMSWFLHPFLASTVIPMIAICCLNCKIYG
jgi:hypothetical protein